MSGDTEAKTKPASARKLAKQREEGSIAQSGELSAMMAAAFAVLAMILLFSPALGLLTDFFYNIATLSTEEFDYAAPLALVALGRTLALFLLPISAIALLTGILITIVYNRGFVFAIKPIIPNLERISFKSGFKRIYGLRGWVETGQALTRIVTWWAIAAAVIWKTVPWMFNYHDCGAVCMAALAWWLVMVLCTVAMGVLIVSGGLDMLVQRFLFLEEQKMSHSEVKRETKEQVGAPEIRQERRRQMKDSTSGADSSGINKANMCFYDDQAAVGLRYHPQHAPLPRVAVRALTLEDSIKLRGAIRDNGFSEMRAPSIVDACKVVSPGGAVPEEIFETLAQAMQQMFGKA